MPRCSGASEHAARRHVGLALKQTVEQFVLGRHIEMADNPDFLAQGAGDLDTETGQAPRFVAIGHRRRIIGNDDAQGSPAARFRHQRAERRRPINIGNAIRNMPGSFKTMTGQYKPLAYRRGHLV